jgi:hypothetical protein
MKLQLRMRICSPVAVGDGFVLDRVTGDFVKVALIDYVDIGVALDANADTADGVEDAPTDVDARRAKDGVAIAPGRPVEVAIANQVHVGGEIGNRITVRRVASVPVGKFTLADDAKVVRGKAIQSRIGEFAAMERIATATVCHRHQTVCSGCAVVREH